MFTSRFSLRNLLLSPDILRSALLCCGWYCFMWPYFSRFSRSHCLWLEGWLNEPFVWTSGRLERSVWIYWRPHGVLLGHCNQFAVLLSLFWRIQRLTVLSTVMQVWQTTLHCVNPLLKCLYRSEKTWLLGVISNLLYTLSIDLVCTCDSYNVGHKRNAWWSLGPDWLRQS